MYIKTMPDSHAIPSYIFIRRSSESRNPLSPKPARMDTELSLL
ncbi:hypothetical protein imdm_1083 [gamma proteobacterium IMCC2047]|nr:hypothetical protein imdm_1083 [gamma proteobacterium IMCC2047]